MNTAPCWISRGEAWTGAEDLVDQLERLTPEQNETLDALVEAHHAVAPCDPDGYCFCWWETMSELCDLDEGHAGPHVFVSQHDIVLGFPEVPA